MDGRAGHHHNPYELTDETPVYVISVAAQLSGLHPQTLRQYDRLGLVSPDRTPGRGRRYSARDIELLRAVQRLSQDEGINLAGIKRILELQHEVEQLREQVFHLANELEAARRAVSRRGRPARPEGGPVRPEGGPVRGELVRRTRVTIFNTAEAEGERPDQGKGGTGGQSGPAGPAGPNGLGEPGTGGPTQD